MKRSMICIAISLLATTVMAQPSVSLSGDLKVAGAYGNGGGTPIDGVAADHWRVNDFSSYIGISGKQDLPHGLHAGFELDAFASVDSGDTWSDSGGSGPFFSRRAVVTLDGDFGRVYVGRAFTPSQIMVLFADPWYWDGSAAQVGWKVQQANYTSTQGLRTDNTVGYISPKMSGLTVSLAAAPGEQTHSRDLGASVTYDSGPIWLGVAYDQSHGVADDPTLNHTVALVAGVDFQFVRPLLSYTSSRVGGVNYSAYSIAATAPLGENGLGKAEFAHLSDFDTVAAGKQGYVKYAVGYQYNFTKAFNLFGELASAKGSGVSATNTVEAGVEYGF